MKLIVDLPEAWEKCNMKFIKDRIRNGEPYEERKTAMWMPDEISCTGFICSNPDCLKKEFWTSPYCPNCGARMEGEGDETD